MMKDILLITNFWHFDKEKDSSRYTTLSDIIVESGYSLEVITSDFYHRVKQKRNYSEDFLKSFNYKITLLNEPVYKKNVSLKRLWAHKRFAKNVLSYLKHRKIPDAIIVVIPSTYVAKYVIKFCKKNNIKSILDIQDLWPEAFKMAFNVPILSSLLFFPMKRMANYAYKNATYITAVSKTYVGRAESVRNDKGKGVPIYLGSNYEYALSSINAISVDKPENEFWITYIGALGYSYNINLVIDAISKLEEDGLTNIVFNVFGNGVLENRFKEYAEKKHIKANFFGHVEYGQMMAYLSKTDIAVNPIIGTSVSSIINKVCDYATAGTAVINDQNSEEYRKMLEYYNCGINCHNDNIESFAEAIKKLYFDTELRNQMRKNAKLMADENFNRKKTYFKMVDILDSICGDERTTKR